MPATRCCGALLRGASKPRSFATPSCKPPANSIPRVGGRSYRIHNVKKIYAQWEVVDNHGPQTWRRMLYQERMRRVDDQIFTAFDFPDCGQVRPKRPVSTTPLQALNLMNSDFVVEQSEFLAERAKKRRRRRRPPDAQVQRCFQLLLSRQPTRRRTRPPASQW